MMIYDHAGQPYEADLIPGEEYRKLRYDLAAAEKELFCRTVELGAARLRNEVLMEYARELRSEWKWKRGAGGSNEQEILALDAALVAAKDVEPDYDAPKPLTPLENFQRNHRRNVP